MQATLDKSTIIAKPVLCPCGSCLPSTWVRDGIGNLLFRSCVRCHGPKMAEYRGQVLSARMNS